METPEYFDRHDDAPIPADDYAQWTDALRLNPCDPDGPRCTWESAMCATCDDLFDVAYEQGRKDFADGVGIIDGATVFRGSLPEGANPEATNWYGQGWGAASLESIVRASKLPEQAFRLIA